jgi:flagellar hook-length control protein FliK
MVNAVANSNVAPQGQSAAASPLSFFTNNATDANGAPVFAQAVRQALNKNTNNTNEQPVATSEPAASDVTAPQPGTGASPSLASGNSVPAKPASKQQPAISSSAPAKNPAALWPNLLTALSPIVSLPTSNVPLPTAALRPPASSSQAELPEQGIAIQQQPAETESGAPHASLQERADAATGNSPAVALPVADVSFADQLLVSASQNQKGSATGATLAAGSFTTPFASPKALVPSATPPASESPASDSTGKSGVAASVSANLVNLLPHGQPVESVLQQLQSLLPDGPAAGGSSSAVIELTRTDTPSSFSVPKPESVLTSVGAAHASSSTSAAAASDAKGAQASEPSQLQTHTLSSVQNAGTEQDAGSSMQDSSAGAGKQNASASSGTNLASSDSQTARSLATSFSEALLSAPVAQPSASQAAPLASAAAPPMVTPLNSSDTPAHSPADPQPSASPQPALPPRQLPDSSATRLVNDAELTNSASQTEMRIAMQTDKLGAIELHARVSGDELGAAIIVEKRDAHAALAVELPALQQALSEKQLRVEQVALTQGSLHSTGGDAGANANTQNGERGNAQAPRSAPVWSETQSVQQAAWYVPEQVGIFDAQGRLSVQA